MLKLSLKLVGKLFKGGLPLPTFAWQISHIGTDGVTNCDKWQLVQSLCPGNTGVIELSAVRLWQSVQPSDACRCVEWLNFE
jgi:hypothetical protein